MGAWLTLMCTSPSKIISIKGRKFIIEKQIGEGGFSFVYLVQDPYSSQRFAIKKTVCQSEELVSASNKEIEILKNFKHRDLLRLLDYEVERLPNGQLVKILMPVYRKGTLDDLLAENRSHIKPKHLREKDILKMFLSVCNGVNEFHKRHPPLAHNDIKPGNMLISETNELVLFDFGSVGPARHTITSRKEALSLQEWTEANMTALFKAPELFDVASDASIDERTDVWALGCTLYAMAFNVSPFEEAATGGSVMLAVTSGQIDIPNGAEKRLSKGFLNLLTNMLNLDPKKRPFIDDAITQVNDLMSQQGQDDVVLDIRPRLDSDMTTS
eukprot:TRINITY_DN7885_c0_g1_i1.p1 TRINITY_DN7885_c0_g1~~TRINITY_DN7885_c0_g1_i1.p1  ORF type:complete len:327 (+),score=66.95 TRINITY_DN7885_c0_g1_i1:149-1129(+)